MRNWSDAKYRRLNYPIETLSFEDALAAEPERLAAGKYHIRHLSYFSKGLYSQQLRHYFERFPRENFFITIFEHFVQEQSRVLGEIAGFLGVDPTRMPADAQLRLNPQTLGEIKTSTRAMLVERYTQSIEELEQIVACELDIWKR